MKPITILFYLSLFCSYGQTISKQVIGPGGITFENDNYKFSYTIGEVVVGAMTDEDNTYQLGNGYYPSLSLSTLSTETLELLQVKVFPNPTKDVIFITHPTEQFFEVDITDINGKHILQTAQQNQQSLSLLNLSKGIYFLIVRIKDLNQTNTYKIIKE